MAREMGRVGVAPVAVWARAFRFLHCQKAVNASALIQKRALTLASDKLNVFPPVTQALHIVASTRMGAKMKVTRSLGH